METRFQLVFEDVVGSNSDVPVLKFRDTESGVETPSFTLDVKRSRSYSKWQICFGKEEKVSSEVERLFKEVVKADKYKLVFETYRKIDLDLEMLGRLCDHLVRLYKITCNEPSFSVSKDDENENGELTYYSPKNSTAAVIC